MKPKFELGQIVATPGALAFLEGIPVNPLDLITRHVCGDWGDLCQEDKDANDFAVVIGLRILSAYSPPEGKLWVITEADRSVTTILLPEEY
jgi:hypothetical protein